MDSMIDIPTISAITRAAQPLYSRELDYARLLRKADESRIVLIGQASHGTHEFYRERVRVTKRLIEDHGFNAVAIEADWQDAHRISRFISGNSADVSSLEALGNFRRFPAYIWRNMDVLAFVEWLREHNEKSDQRVGFYGLDLYNLYASMQAVLRHLEKLAPIAAPQARYRYRCFDQFGESTEYGGYAENYDLNETREREIVEQVVDLLRHGSAFDDQNEGADHEKFLLAGQNPDLLKNAEAYYRAMIRGSVESWNLRAQHMTDTLEQLAESLGDQAKIVVWAHNSQVGDARATEMSRRGKLNIGQLIRQHFGESSLLIGFTTYSGEVTAASEWDGPAERRVLNRAIPNSYESLFHATGIQDFLLSLKEDPAVHRALSRPRLERAIGVIYLPETERLCHYFECHLADQFDFIIHFDRSRALVPLEKRIDRTKNVMPETYPHAI
jgi:erythromycin esterase-like protein